MEIVKDLEIKKSRKWYNCEGREQLERNSDENDSDHKEIIDQIKSCSSIKKGDPYFKQVQRDGGNLEEFKSCNGCWNIINKFNLYEND